MPKRKNNNSRSSGGRGGKSHQGPSFHRDFKEPTKIQRREAIGVFPCPTKTSHPRQRMIDEASHRLLLQQPPSSLLPLQQQPASSSSSNNDNNRNKFHQKFFFSPTDLDDAKLYQPTNRSETTFAIAKPRDEQDWLACVAEEPQTFDDYTKFLMSPRGGGGGGGRMRPICNATRDDIVLVPIISGGGRGGGGGAAVANTKMMWPNHGVPLEPLVELTKAYFANRPVRLLPPAVIMSPEEQELHTTTTTTTTTSKKKKTTTATTFDIYFPTASSSSSSSSTTSSSEEEEQEEETIVYEITGRVDMETGKTQYNVETLLSSLVNYRDDDDNKTAADGGPPLSTNSFCVMALTMEDLYQSSSDLFIAGLAAGGSKVAVFSFARYHPHMKIHPQSWYDYGYGNKADNYSYFDGSKPNQWTKQRESLMAEPPTFDDLTPKWQAEFHRRCGKLLVHELMHLYGLGHCIFNRCIMMGTGHLVEDFAAPFHLCGVCLRKMQWRLGFDVIGRYELLADAFDKLDLQREGTWTRKQVEALTRNTKCCDNATIKK